MGAIRYRNRDGYVPEEQIRSPIEQAACFVKGGNGWRMTAFAPAGGEVARRACLPHRSSGRACSTCTPMTGGSSRVAILAVSIAALCHGISKLQRSTCRATAARAGCCPRTRCRLFRARSSRRDDARARLRRDARRRRGDRATTRRSIPTSRATPTASWLEAAAPAIRTSPTPSSQRYDVGRLKPGTALRAALPAAAGGRTARACRGSPSCSSWCEARGDDERALQHRDEDLAARARRDAGARGLRARAARRDPQRRHGSRVDDPVLRLAHAADRAEGSARRFRPSTSRAERASPDNIAADGSPWTAGFKLARHGGSVPRMVKAAGGAIWSPYYQRSHAATRRRSPRARAESGRRGRSTTEADMRADRLGRRRHHHRLPRLLVKVATARAAASGTLRSSSSISSGSSPSSDTASSRHRDRQLEAPRAGASRIEIEHPVAPFDERLVRVPADHRRESRRRGIDVEIRDVVKQVDDGARPLRRLR